MNQNPFKCWNVLSWNVRGVNASWKWNAVRDKVVEAGCDILCFQETKRDNFDLQFLRNVCPTSFDSFEFLPSVGASGGILLAWKRALFIGELLFSNEFAISVDFIVLHKNMN
jgi:exonuclease III